MGVYLVPASSENIAKSLENGIDLLIAKKFLVEYEYNQLVQLLSKENKFYCWAMTEPSRSKFEKMRKDDIVFFAEKNTGAFTYQAEVLFKIENENLGNFLWNYVPTKPWKLIYFLTNIKKIYVDKSKLVQALGYDANYQVPGVIKAKESNLTDEIEKIKGIPENLNKFNTNLKVKKNNFLSSTISTKYFEEQTYEVPEIFKELVNYINILKKDSAHKERAHESLVEYFFEKLGFDKYDEISYQMGRVDISIKYKNKLYIVIEVKKDWNLSYKDTKVVKQAYSYAIDNGARFVIATNGDYYAIFDRAKGLDLESNFLGEFKLTQLSKESIKFIEKLKKENLLNL